MRRLNQEMYLKAVLVKNTGLNVIFVMKILR